MKKVLIFTYSYGRGGSELNAYKIIKLLSNTRFDWGVINNADTKLLDEIKTIKNLDNYFSLNLFNSKSIKIFNYLKTLFNILKKENYQTVYAVGFLPALLISLVKPFFLFRFISTRRERMPWARFYHVPFIFFINMSSDYIETNSKTIETELKKSNLLKKKIYYIPNIILNHTNKKHKIFLDQKKKYIGNIANVRSPKNIDLFLSLTLNMTKKNDELIFILVGKDSFDGKVKNFIRKNKLQNRLFIFEDISYNDIFTIYLGLDIFLFTSIYEGSPNVLYEALSAEVPIVASKIFATKELIEDGVNGYLCDLNNEDEFIKKLDILLNNKVQYNLIKKNIKKYFNKSDFNRIAVKEINNKIIWNN